MIIEARCDAKRRATGHEIYQDFDQPDLALAPIGIKSGKPCRAVVEQHDIADPRADKPRAIAARGKQLGEDHLLEQFADEILAGNRALENAPSDEAHCSASAMSMSASRRSPTRRMACVRAKTDR